MTTDYDRISADDLTHQTEEQHDQTEGGQTTAPVKTRRGPAKKAAGTKPAGTGSRKTAKTASPRKAKPARAKAKPAHAKAAARAEAARLAEDQLILTRRITALFDEGAAQKSSAKRLKKTEATGLVWTLSALALAACGGGGGGSPAPVTGGRNLSTGPDPVIGGDNPEVVTSEYIANQELTDSEKAGLRSELKAMTEMTVTSLADVEGADTGAFTATGAFEVQNHKVAPDKMISVQVGGIIDPTTGIQLRGGGTDANGNYEGPSNWYSLPGSLLITPITNYLARRYALERHRDSLGEDNPNSGLNKGKDAFFQAVLDELFEGTGVTVTLADILDPMNYILPNSAEYDLLVQNKNLDNDLTAITKFGDGTELGTIDAGSGNARDRTLADVNLADAIARKALELFIHDTDRFQEIEEDQDRADLVEDELARLIALARDIEEGKPVAIPVPELSVAEDSANGYAFALTDFGFSDPGGNDPDPDGDPQTDDAIPSQLTAVRFVTASGRDDVALRPGEDLNPVSAADITYDDYGTLYLITEDGRKAVTAGQEISAEDIRAGNLIFVPAADFDRTAEFEIQVSDGEEWSEPVRLFITVEPREDGPSFYSAAIPPDARRPDDDDGRASAVPEAHVQPLEVVAQDGGVNLFAYQALADDPDTKDSFADITYALKQGLGDDAGLFTINANTGEVRFITKPDAEIPHDLNTEAGIDRSDSAYGQADGTYVFTVIATSPDGRTVEQTVHLTVQNRNDEVRAEATGSDHYITLAAGEYLEVVKAGGEGWQGIAGGAPRTFESHIRINTKASDAKPTSLFAYGSSQKENAGGEWFIIEMNADGLLQLNTNINTGTQQVPKWTRHDIAANHDRIDDNKWYHIAVTYEAGLLTVWLDQVIVLSYEIELNTTADALFRLGDSTHLFEEDAAKNGDVSFDNFRVWDRVLDQEELIAASRIHKYGSSDLNAEATEQVPNLVLEYSFDRLESGTSPDGEETGTGEILDNAGHGHNARLHTSEGAVDIFAEVEQRIATDPSRSGELAVVVENSWLILSNEMFGIWDQDLADADEGVTFHMANVATNSVGGTDQPVDGRFEVWDGTAWQQSDIFTLGALKAGKVRFVHDGAEHPVINIRYSVYDGLEDGARALGKPLAGGEGAGFARHITTAERVFTIGVVNVNDRPEAANQVDTILEDGRNLFGPSADGTVVDRFSFTDDDAGNPSAVFGKDFAAIQITDLPDRGLLTLQGVGADGRDENGKQVLDPAFITGVNAAGEAIIAVNAIIAADDLHKLVYTPPADANSLNNVAYASFRFRVWDGDDENSWSHLPNTDPSTHYEYKIQVDERNDTPTIAANPGAFGAAGATEDQVFDGFVHTMFNFRDVDWSRPPNDDRHDEILTMIRVAGLPDTAEGYLIRDNGAGDVHLVEAGDLFWWDAAAQKFKFYEDGAGDFSAAQQKQHILKFVPAPDFNGEATFTFTVLDRFADKTLRPGDEGAESAPAVFTLDVAAQNDEAETAGEPNSDARNPAGTHHNYLDLAAGNDVRAEKFSADDLKALFEGGDSRVTIEFWFRTADINAAVNLFTVSETNRFGRDTDFFTFGVNAAGKIFFDVDGTLLTATHVQDVHSRKVSDNKWHHVALSVAGGQTVFYLDGIQAGPAFSVELDRLITAISELRIGGSDVDIDNFRIWSKLLNREGLSDDTAKRFQDVEDSIAAAIQEAAKTYKYGAGTAGLELEYVFDTKSPVISDDGSEKTWVVKDSSGNDRHGKVTHATDPIAATPPTTTTPTDEPNTEDTNLFAVRRTDLDTGVTEGGTLVLDNTLFKIADRDHPDHLVSVRIVSVLDSDDRDAGAAGDPSQAINDGHIEVFNVFRNKWVASSGNLFTLKQLKDGDVRFVHNGDESTHLTLTFYVWDPQTSEADAQKNHTDQFDIHITNVNDRPTAMNLDLTLNEGESFIGFTPSMFSFADDDSFNQDQHQNYRSIDYNRGFADTYHDYKGDGSHDTPASYKTPSRIGPFDENNPYESVADSDNGDGTTIADWDRFEAIRFTEIPSAKGSPSLLFLRPWDHLGEENAFVTMTVPDGQVWQQFGATLYADEGGVKSAYRDGGEKANQANWKPLTDIDSNTDGTQIRFSLAALQAGLIRSGNTVNTADYQVRSVTDLTADAAFSVTVPQGQTWQKNVATDPVNDPAVWEDQTTDTDSAKAGLQLMITAADLAADLWRVSDGVTDPVLTLGDLALKAIDTNLRPSGEGDKYAFNTDGTILRLADLDDKDEDVAVGQVIDVRDLARLVLKPTAAFKSEYASLVTLKFEVFDGKDWSEVSYTLTLNLDGKNRAPAPVNQNPDEVNITERDEDFGVAASDDNRNASDVPQPLTEYALQTGHFTAVHYAHLNSEAIYFDAAALAAANGRIEVYNPVTALWGLPGSTNHLGDEHVAGSVAGQFAIGQLRAGHVRLRYDVADNPDTPQDFYHVLKWGFADGSYDHTAEVRPPHIVVLTQADFGDIADGDLVHDSHNITVTVTLPRDAADGTIQVWENSVWATPDDAQAGQSGHQVDFTLQQLEDGHVRYVHGGGETPRVVLDWTVRDTGVDEIDDGGTNDDLSSGPWTLKINVAPVNDRPVSDKVIRRIDEDTTQDFTRTEIPFEDADARTQDDELRSVKIMSVTYGASLGGTLKVNDRILKAGDFITADEIDSLTFTPDANQWDSVTVTVPAGQIWQRFDGPVPGVYDWDASSPYWVDINDEHTQTVTISWSDLSVLRVKPSYTTVTLSTLGQYFTQPGTTTDVTAEWLQTDVHNLDGEVRPVHWKTDYVKVTAKNDAYVEVFANGQWSFWADAVIDNYIVKPDTRKAADGVQAMFTYDLVAAGHVRIVDDYKVMTRADILDASKWHEVFVSVGDKFFALTDSFDFAAANTITGATVTYNGVTIDLADIDATDLTDHLSLADVKAIAGATVTYNGVTIDLADIDATDLTDHLSLADVKAISGVKADYKGAAFDLDDVVVAEFRQKITLAEFTSRLDKINPVLSDPDKITGLTINDFDLKTYLDARSALATKLVLTDVQNGNTKGITGISWTYRGDKDVAHLGLNKGETDQDFKFHTWDGTAPSGSFRKSALKSPSPGTALNRRFPGLTSARTRSAVCRLE